MGAKAVLTMEESNFCDDLLRYGDIIYDSEYVTNGAFTRHYVIKSGEKIYHLLKVNGEWIFNACY